jgi:hypothetical protein
MEFYLLENFSISVPDSGFNESGSETLFSTAKYLGHNVPG